VSCLGSLLRDQRRRSLRPHSRDVGDDIWLSRHRANRSPTRFGCRRPTASVNSPAVNGVPPARPRRLCCDPAPDHRRRLGNAHSRPAGPLRRGDYCMRSDPEPPKAASSRKPTNRNEPIQPRRLPSVGPLTDKGVTLPAPRVAIRHANSSTSSGHRGCARGTIRAPWLCAACCEAARVSAELVRFGHLCPNAQIR
jgi:hypothetical protein